MNGPAIHPRVRRTASPTRVAGRSTCRRSTCRRAAVALACLALCSCQMMRGGASSDDSATATRVAARSVPKAGAHGTLPPQAWNGGAPDGCTTPFGTVPIEPTADLGVPLPETTIAPWSPPGIARPWPHDEYLHDGGDRGAQVTVSDNGQINGLEMEDTIVHFDTVDGRRLVEPSNRVSLYAPRFGAVRQVTVAREDGQQDYLTEVDNRLKAHLNEERRRALTAVQPLQPEGELGLKQPSLERLEQGEGKLITRVQLAQTDGGLLHHEDLRIIHNGQFSQDERPQIVESIDAALAWTVTKAVQVILDGKPIPVLTGDERVQATFGVKEPDNPRLRVIKTASTKTAQPGEIVDFTIRFDNIGDQTIGNVTLVDNLTTRLEYVPDSAQSSREAEFFTTANEGDSLVLRWEFTDPLKAGDGGVVHFHCRVR